MVTQVPVRDRTWQRFRTARAAGPLDVPDAEAVRDRLRALARRSPDHPVLGRLDGHRLVPAGDLEAHLRSLVVEVPDDLDADALAERLVADPHEELPLQLVLAPHAAGMDVAHVLADGATANGWFRWLLGDEVPPPDAPDLRFPLLRAGLALAARPRRAARAVLGAVPLAPPDERPHRPAAMGSVRVASALVPVATLDAMRAWRDEHAPGTSAASVLMARTTAALAERIPLGPGVRVMMDARRYLPGERRVAGNFATGPYLDVDPTDPVALGAAVSRAAADGTPLVLLAALTARNVVRGPGRAPVTAGGPPRADVTLSHQGRLDLSGLPWRDADDAVFVVAGRPAGPEAVTVCFVPTPAGVHVTATAGDGVLDAEAVRAAVASLSDAGAADPPGPSRR